MGFPRIISKQNKIYTKLGEFCLSGEAGFWIVCQVCQEAIETQDKFWKHIQDEHNFMHGIGIKNEQNHRGAYSSADIVDSSQASCTTITALPLYRKILDDEHRGGGVGGGGNNHHHHLHQLQQQQLQPQHQIHHHLLQQQQQQQQHEDNSQESHDEQHEPKDYTEMRSCETNAMAVDIKVEPTTSLNQTLIHQIQQQQQQLNLSTHSVAGVGGATTPSSSSTASTSMYQMAPQAPASAYATIIHNTPTITAAAGVAAAATTMPSLNMSMASVVPIALLHAQDTKDFNNSTTTTATTTTATITSTALRNASSAGTTIIANSGNNGGGISPEDGERWYICDYEPCGLKFKYQSRLELHRSVHSKERRFACELCGASFKQSCNLSTHRKKKHFLKGLKSIVQQRY